MNLYFVSGASGSGKTAILPECQKILGSKMRVYDFDDIGVPEGADNNESPFPWSPDEHVSLQRPVTWPPIDLHRYGDLP